MSSTEVDARNSAAEKIRLEVEALRSAASWKRAFLPYAPLLTVIVAVIGVLVGIHQNNLARIEENRKSNDARIEQNRQSNLARAEEFRRRFWERQLEKYVEACRVAAQLSTLPDGPERDKAYARFLELYHGDLVIFEDPPVRDAMKSFAQLYIDYRHEPKLQIQAQRAARVLALRCRESAAARWGVELVTTIDMENP
jgi:hypothetical protein